MTSFADWLARVAADVRVGIRDWPTRRYECGICGQHATVAAMPVGVGALSWPEPVCSLHPDYLMRWVPDAVAPER